MNLPTTSYSWDGAEPPLHSLSCRIHPLGKGWLCHVLPWQPETLVSPISSTKSPQQAALYLLEAVPFFSGAPEVLSQGIQELTQLLGAHSHFLPDQLQVL